MTASPPDMPAGLALAWGVVPEPTRGPKRELSLERIVTAGIAIADADGLEALSMGAVARACGVTTMALYRYVPSKDDLLLLMWDHALGAPPTLDGLPWRDALRSWVARQVEILLSHPWTLDIPIKGAPNTPRALAWADAALGALAHTPLALPQRLAVVLAVDAHARWQATLQRRWPGEPSPVESERLAPVMHLIGPERLPHFHAAMTSEDWRPDFDEFAYGLDLLLDGVERAVT